MDPWAKIVSGYDELTRIEIPEWGEEDQPFVAFSRPATVEDEIAVRRVVKQIDSPETWARLVFNKLLNEDGSAFLKASRLRSSSAKRRVD